MKTTLLFTVICFIFFNVTNAQLALDWAKATSGGYGSYCSAQAVENNGNVIITGNFTGTHDFDPGPGTANLSSAGSNSKSDIYIAKYDSLGNYIWAFSLGGSDIDRGHDVIVDGMGNIYITGHFHDSVDFDPGPGIAKRYASRSYEKFIAKYDSSGNYQWAVNYGSTWGYAIEFDHAGNILSGGRQSAGNDYDPGPGVVTATSGGYIIKFDPNGNFMSVREYSSSLGFINDIETDVDGNMLFTGWFNNTVDFDPGPGTQNLTPYGTLDPFVAKYDSTGNYLWAFHIGNTAGSHGRGHDISTDGYGNVYLTGEFSSSGSKIDLDPGVDSAYFTRNGTSNGFIAKYTANGNYRWGMFIGNTSVSTGYGIVADAVGNVYATGRMTGTTDFDPGPGTANVSSYSTSRSDIYMAQYTINGSYVDAFVISDSDGAGTDVEIDNSGKILVNGVFSRSTDFDHGPGTLNLSNTSTYADGFLLKYNGCNTSPGQPGMLTGPDTVCSGSIHSYAVTNTTGATSYTWSLPAGWMGNSSDTNITVVAGVNSGTVSVTADNGCGSSIAQSMSVHVNYVDTSVTQNGNILSSNNGNSGVTYQWLDCNNSYAPVSGANNQSYTASSNGSYAVQVTENGCVDTSACYSIISVGMDGTTIKTGLTVYPNPSDGLFTINIDPSNLPRVQSLSVVDLLGHEVIRMQANNSAEVINLSKQPKGLYFLQLHMEDKITVTKLILQ